MSWAEDMGYDAWSIWDIPPDRESQWKLGEHEDKTGKKHLIKDMTDQHLRNTIRHFHGLDTTPLKKELENRNK